MLSGHEVIVADNFFTGRYVPLTGMKSSDEVFGTNLISYCRPNFTMYICLVGAMSNIGLGIQTSSC